MVLIAGSGLETIKVEVAGFAPFDKPFLCVCIDRVVIKAVIIGIVGMAELYYVPAGMIDVVAGDDIGQPGVGS